MADIEKVIKALESQIEFMDSTGNSCAYSAIVMRDALELLKEYKQLQGWATGHGLTMCKNCKHRGNADKCVIAAIAKEKDYLYPISMLDNRGEWFCADGQPERI